ncbi:hypothetical protein DSM112329_04311 [Paraconexibacter sp. AEG42_29]|uniref:MacB-like periplasmic core domain-containing protein n=1 Tax=Paraconexibacter sp. AEG42_29 TaxID=2997339 RepID=A0AAU7B1H6_9ACTN
MSLVREELGPTLPQLARPHWARISRAHRRLLGAALAAFVLLLAAAYAVLRSDPLETLVVREPIAFNLIHRADFPKVDPRPGELLRLEGVLPGKSGAKETYAVSALTVPPYRGDISSAFLGLATRKLAELQAADPQLRYRGEGKTRINLIPGYQLTYSTREGGRPDGRTVFGRVFWLVPEPEEEGGEQTREGAVLALTAQFSGQVPNPTALGSDVLLKAPLRSFRFGTERP